MIERKPKASKVVTVRELAAERTADVIRLPVVNEFEAERPKTRGQCVNGPRPCGWISCSHNTFLDVDQHTGSIQFNFGDLEPHEMAPERSCALDTADQGGATLEVVSERLNTTRERARQIEENVIHRVRRLGARRLGPSAILREYQPEGAKLRGMNTGLSSCVRRTKSVKEADEVVVEEAPFCVSFFAGGAGADEAVCESVWGMFAKDSDARGIPCKSARSVAASKALAKRRAAVGR